MRLWKRLCTAAPLLLHLLNKRSTAQFVQACSMSTTLPPSPSASAGTSSSAADYPTLVSLLREITHLQGISGLLGWDEMVMLPEGSSDARGAQVRHPFVCSVCVCGGGSRDVY